MNWRLVGIVTLVVAAAATGWSVWTNRPDERRPLDPDARSDYILDDFEVVVLDDEGRESFTLAAPKLERHPGDRTMSMATPVFYIPASPGNDLPRTREAGWEVHSQAGWVSADGEELRLTGGVTAKTVGQRERPITMTTEQLNIFPRKDRATSPSLVTVEQSGSILRGHGMEALLDSKRIRFNSNVKVRYAPPTR